jgi:hypothetical protein
MGKNMVTVWEYCSKRANFIEMLTAKAGNIRILILPKT